MVNVDQAEMQSTRMKPVLLDWEPHREHITQLYQHQKQGLSKVMESMAQEFSFVASAEKYKKQLKKWNIMRNLNRTDVALSLYALEEIERENRKQSVLLRDRVMTRADINSYLKKAKTTEEEIRKKTPRPAVWPSHITFSTPETQLQIAMSHGRQGTGSFPDPYQPIDPVTPSWTTTTSWNMPLGSSKMHTPQSSLSQRTSRSSMHIHPSGIVNMDEDEALAADSWGHFMPESDGRTDDSIIFDEDEVTDGDCADICAGFAESSGFGAIIQQAVAPQPILGGHKTDPMLFSFLSSTAPSIFHPNQQQKASERSQALHATFPGHAAQDWKFSIMSYSNRIIVAADNNAIAPSGLAISFLTLCLYACIMEGQGFQEPAEIAMAEAASCFKDMMVHDGPYCLTTLNLLTSFLEAHGRRPMAERILRNSLLAARECGESDNAIYVTICFMAEIVGGRARESDFSVDRLRQVYEELAMRWGPDSPSAFLGLYHVAWSLALRKETCPESWVILESLNTKCEQELGCCHIQTITSMMTSARVLHHLQKPWAAAEMVNKAIDRLDLMYQDFHPYRLEARSRQATLLMQLKGAYDVESILQDVVTKQAEILGSQNPRTQSTMKNLQKFLNEKGRGEEARRLPKILNDISLNWPFELH